MSILFSRGLFCVTGFSVYAALSKKVGGEKIRSEIGNLGPSADLRTRLFYDLKEITNPLSFNFLIHRTVIVSPDSLAHYEAKWHNAYNRVRKIVKRPANETHFNYTTTRSTSYF